MSHDALTTEPITRTTLGLYAAASWDHNPLHIDSDFARENGLEDVIGHGMLSMAYLGRWVTDRYGVDCIAEFAVRFLAVTSVGDVLVCSGQPAALMERDGKSVRRVELAVSNQRGESVLAGHVLVVEGE
jgi:acyl dehydratase